MDLFTQVLLVYSIRGVGFLIFIWTLSWKSILYLGVFIVLWYYTAIKQKPEEKKHQVKTRDIITDLYPVVDDEELDKQIIDGIVSMVTYEAHDALSVQRFEWIKLNSNCLFARHAKVWGCPSWKDELCLEGNIYRLLPMFLKFTIVCPSKKLDAFLMELPGDIYGQNIQDFGKAVYKVLKVLSDNDPAKIHCMNKSYLGKRGWVFEFNKVTFFITTFAPFYPENHARYAFGAENCYILFQPELSFAFHDLPPDTPETHWEKPETVRDKIRIAFKEAGRSYYIPENVHGPMVHEIVRPVNDTDKVYEWWNHS